MWRIEERRVWYRELHVNVSIARNREEVEGKKLKEKRYSNQ